MKTKSIPRYLLNQAHEFLFASKKVLLLLISLILLSACEDFLQINPPKTQITTDTAFKDDAVATSTIVGIYSEMIRSGGFASGNIASITVKSGLSSDELISHSTINNPFYLNALDANNGDIRSSLWSEGYKFIYFANAAIQGLSQSSGLSPTIKDQLLGEAKFVRAFCYFHLVNLFGDVPLITSTSYEVNVTMSRAPMAQVYEQVIADLLDAENLMSATYVANQKSRPNRFAATSLLARTYLFKGDWTSAEEKATTVINSAAYSLQSNLNAVFLKNSTEAIWQLSPVLTGRNTNEGAVFILSAAPNSVSLSTSLVSAFEPGDTRLTNWTKSINANGQSYYYPYKYKIASGATVDEYSMVLRFAEQYLIRAEARAQLNNISGAQSDLNMIRNRAGLTNTNASSQATLLQAIEGERRSELFTEWGHRWFDLKRWRSFTDITKTRADDVLGALKPATWEATDILYPIPQSERKVSPNLTQNPGYQ